MKKPLRLGFACAARSWMDARAFVPTVRVRLQHHPTVRVTVDLRSPRLALRTPRGCEPSPARYVPQRASSEEQLHGGGYAHCDPLRLSRPADR